MSPFAIAWIVTDIVALVPAAALLAKRQGMFTLELGCIVAAQLVVIASAIAAGATASPLSGYAEWTLMFAVNIGYALVSWRSGASSRLLATVAIVFTVLAVALFALRSFSSIIALAIGLAFAVGALFAALLQPRRVRARA